MAPDLRNLLHIVLAERARGSQHPNVLTLGASLSTEARKDPGSPTEEHTEGSRGVALTCLGCCRVTQGYLASAPGVMCLSTLDSLCLQTREPDSFFLDIHPGSAALVYQTVLTNTELKC